MNIEKITKCFIVWFLSKFLLFCASMSIVALNKTGRPIFFSMCEWWVSFPGKWHKTELHWKVCWSSSSLFFSLLRHSFLVFPHIWHIHYSFIFIRGTVFSFFRTEPRLHNSIPRFQVFPFIVHSNVVCFPLGNLLLLLPPPPPRPGFSRCWGIHKIKSKKGGLSAHDFILTRFGCVVR